MLVLDANIAFSVLITGFRLITPEAVLDEIEENKDKILLIYLNWRVLKNLFQKQKIFAQIRMMSRMLHYLWLWIKLQSGLMTKNLKRNLYYFLIQAFRSQKFRIIRKFSHFLCRVA